jgi:hypothetical protein
MAAAQVLAAVSWDPQLRGALILLIGIVILPGSVLLLLSTNLGMRLGILMAAAGLSGLLLLLNIIWLMAPLGTGPIGYKGSAPGWRTLEIVKGDLPANSGIPAVTGTPGKPETEFPNGWTYLAPGNPTLAAAGPAADTALTPGVAGSPTPAFPPPFTTSQDYVVVGAWAKGGHNPLINLFGYKVYWRIRRHQIYFKHRPRYVVIRVQPSLPSVTLAGTAATLPAADATSPVYSVVLLRDVGSLREPPLVLGLASLIVFAVTVEKLHSRDKEIARRQREGPGGDGGGPGGSGRPVTPEPEPAGELEPA